MFKINLGELKHSIVIQHEIIIKNEDGIPTALWKDKFVTKAKVLNLRGLEFVQALGTNSKATKTFYIRAPRKITIDNTDRIIYNNEQYNIVYVNDIEDKGLWIEIRCERVDV